MTKLILDGAPNNLVDFLNAQSESVEILKSTEIWTLGSKYDTSDPRVRWEHLKLAAEGARLYSNKEDKESPLYAGPLPKDSAAVQLLIADLIYTQQQLDYMAKFGVSYIGRIQTDPRNILVLDHKKASERHDQEPSHALEAFLKAAPKDWWGTLGVVSAGNADKLQAFLEATLDAIPLAYSPGAVAKLKYAGREFVQFDDPNTWTGNIIFRGTEIRGKANDLSKKLAIAESTYGKPQAVPADGPAKPSLEVPAELLQ